MSNEPNLSKDPKGSSIEPQSIIDIGTTILKAPELLPKLQQALTDIIPGAEDDLKDKLRWIQCCVKNLTQFKLLVLESYFDSGGYWAAPKPEKDSEFTQVVFSGSNGNGPTGVTGGTAFRLSLDTKTFFDFAVGWTMPLIGSNKAGVVESSKAKDGYDIATPGGNYIQSKNSFKGKDKDGKDAQFAFFISASPGKDPMVVMVDQVLSVDGKLPW